jgi:hypothetical protein
MVHNPWLREDDIEMTQLPYRANRREVEIRADMDQEEAGQDRPEHTRLPYTASAART